MYAFIVFWVNNAVYIEDSKVSVIIEIASNILLKLTALIISKSSVEKYVIERFNQLESYHASTVILAVKTGAHLTDAKLHTVSVKANEFFGKTAYSKDLIGKSGDELMRILQEWMKRKDYDLFENDQARVFQQYSDDQEAHAEVPVVFNDKHPHHPNGVFLPVIVTLGPIKTKKKNEQTERFIQITYLDLKPLMPIAKKYAT